MIEQIIGVTLVLIYILLVIYVVCREIVKFYLKYCHKYVVRACSCIKRCGVKLFRKYIKRQHPLDD